MFKELFSPLKSRSQASFLFPSRERSSCVKLIWLTLAKVPSERMEKFDMRLVGGVVDPH